MIPQMINDIKYTAVLKKRVYDTVTDSFLDNNIITSLNLSNQSYSLADHSYHDLTKHRRSKLNGAHPSNKK